MHLGMAGEDLLHEGGAGARIADDENGQLRSTALAGPRFHEFSRKTLFQPRDPRPELRLVIGLQAALQAIALEEAGKGVVESFEVLVGFAEGEQQQGPVRNGLTLLGGQALEPRQLVGREFAGGSEIEPGRSRYRRGCDGTREKGSRL